MNKTTKELLCADCRQKVQNAENEYMKQYRRKLTPKESKRPVSLHDKQPEARKLTPGRPKHTPCKAANCPYCGHK